jgi:drug/metabolite transporter (DMT)-like permease
MADTLQATAVMVSGPARSSAAVAVGLASAGAFAVSNALQHQAAGRLPETVHRALAVLGYLARQRIWVAGTCISFCALVLHALALQIGSIALVQPLMLVGVVLAVPARAALEHKSPHWDEVRAVGVTVIGLGAFIVSTNPQPADEPAAIPSAVAFVVGSFVVGLGILRASRTSDSGEGRFQAALLGVGAGVMFGSTAGLLKLVGTPATWQSGRLVPVVVLGMLMVAGLLGTAMNQRAYQIAPIAFSMPLVNVVDIVVAVLFGAVVFGELPAHTLATMTIQIGALACVSAGLAMIAALRPRLAADNLGPAPASQLS